MTLRATSAFEPSASFLRAAVIAFTTSSGSCVDVRRINSRIVSKSAGCAETSRSGAVAVIYCSREASLSHRCKGVDILDRPMPSESYRLDAAPPPNDWLNATLIRWGFTEAPVNPLRRVVVIWSHGFAETAVWVGESEL